MIPSLSNRVHSSKRGGNGAEKKKEELYMPLVNPLANLEVESTKFYMQ